MTDDNTYPAEFTEDDYKPDPVKDFLSTGLIANELVAVRPMPALNGTVFFMEYWAGVNAPDKQPKWLVRSRLYQALHVMRQLVVNLLYEWVIRFKLRYTKEHHQLSI